MSRDIHLQGVSLEVVVEKRRLDQALNAKEFAVLAGISYSTAREWFRSAGFPVLRGVIFWGDFVEWRRGQIGLNQRMSASVSQTQTTVVSATYSGANSPPCCNGIFIGRSKVLKVGLRLRA